MVIGLCFMCINFLKASEQIVVSPGGDDTNPGTPAQPLATLSAAQETVREVVAAGLEADLVVRIQEGVYELADTLAFGAEDSGSERFAVTYAAAPGARVVVSGGTVIDGWEKHEGELWTAQVPGVKENEWYFRQLWVNGRRAIRARMPNAGDRGPRRKLEGFKVDNELTSTILSFNPDLLEEWGNLEDVEAVVFGTWEIMRKRFAQVDPETGVGHMQGPHSMPHFAQGRTEQQRTAGRRGRFFLENAAEFLDRPGEWYLDRQTGTLTYWPRPGEDTARARVIAPRLERLVDVKGTPEHPVRNLHFQGIEFKHADWRLPRGGYMGVQACCYVLGAEESWRRMDAAIRLENARDCSITESVIAHIGGCGIEFLPQCVRLTLEGNHINDIGGNGIMAGSPSRTLPEADAPKDCRIANNHIHDCGIDYPGGVGIWVGLAQRTVIAHNLLHDLPYSGISLGWNWNSDPTLARNNLIEWNHVHDVMQRLSDGGGIYTLGFQPGTIIRHNYIHDVPGGSHNNGIFLDQGSKGFRLAGNAIGRTGGAPVRFNQNRREDHEWEDNLEGNLEGDPVRSCALEVPHDDALEPDHLTIEAWIKPEEFPDGRWWIVNKNGNEWDDGHYGVIASGSRIRAVINIGGGRENKISATSQEGVLEAEVWQHVAMSFDGAKLRVYHNGIERASTSVHRERSTAKSPLAIGHRADDASPYSPFRFKGFIDRVRLYDQALTADEIVFSLTTRDAPPSRTPVAAWFFEDIVASAVADARERASHHQIYLQAIAKAGLQSGTLPDGR